MSSDSILAGGIRRNLNWVVSANLVGGLSNFASGVWFARALGPGAMGEYAVLVTALQILAGLLSPGFDQAIIRFPKRAELVSAAFAATHLQSAVLALAALGVYSLHLHRISATSAEGLLPGLVLLLSIIGFFYANLLSAPLAANLAYRKISQIRVVATFSSILVGVCLVRIGVSYWALVFRDLVLATVTLLLMVWYSPLSLRREIRSPDFGLLMQFNASLWALNILEKLVLRLDYAMVGFLFGKEGLGIYFSFRAVVEGVMAFLVQPIQTVVFSYHCQNRNGQKGFRWLGWKILVGYFLLVVLIGSLVHVVGGKGIELLFGGKFAAASGLVFGLCLYAGAIIAFEYLKVVSMAEGLHSSVVGPRLLQLMLLPLLLLLLAHTFGFRGTAWATGLAAWVLVFTTSFRLKRGLGRAAGDAPNSMV